MLATSHFKEMTYPEIHEYLEFSQREYAQGMLDQGEYPDYETSLRAARSEINHYYNTLIEGESHYAYNIFDHLAKKVGMLAFSILVKRGGKDPFVFIDYVTVFPEERRRGHAKAAMRFAEDFARQNKIKCVKLNVMKHKKGAVALYKGLGYDVYQERALGFSKEPGRYDMQKFV